MKKVILAAAFTLVSLSSALASPLYDQMYHDNIRLNGHPRPQAVYDAALDACYSQTGLARDAKDTQAFKDCMATHDFRWVYSRPVKDPQQTGHIRDSEGTLHRSRHRTDLPQHRHRIDL